MVSDTLDNPPSETTLASVYMWKQFPYRPSQSWPCMIIHNPYWIIKCADIPLSMSFPRSFDHSGFCKVKFHFLDTGFCFKPLILNLGISWHLLCRELSRLGEPKCLYVEKSSRLPGLPYPLSWDMSPHPETTRGHSYKWLLNWPRVTRGGWGECVSVTCDHILMAPFIWSRLPETTLPSRLPTVYMNVPSCLWGRENLAVSPRQVG